MARFYANENFPLPAVEELRRLGHDVLTVQETGKANQAMSDEAVLDWASAAGRIVLTINRKHFVRLHRSRAAHSGIVVCSLDADLIALARRVNQMLIGKADLSGLLIRVDRPSVP